MPATATELLARTVGPTGVVYAQDSSAVIERFVKDKFDIRAQKPAMKNVVHVVRNFDDPIPPEVSGLDMITFFFAYHDVTYMEVDRAEMNRKMFAALKPGGFLVIADPFRASRRRHGGRKKPCNRIEESALRQEIEARRFQARDRGRFPAPSGRSAGCRGIPSADTDRPIRSEISEAAVKHRARFA